MPVNVSEKQLYTGVVLLFIAVAIFLSATLLKMPVRIAELKLLMDLGAVVLIVFSVRLIARSIHRQ
ncbi:MAG TPA: hypothetical protein VGN63_00895 [Flavisolibacter sp.]|jgi:hypothetical protein|nr:hypothetical protein [Flavisolibacter sp.]